MCPHSGCEGCGESCRDKPLMGWNLKRLRPAVVDKAITVCGVCMGRFKHKKVHQFLTFYTLVY